MLLIPLQPFVDYPHLKIIDILFSYGKAQYSVTSVRIKYDLTNIFQTQISTNEIRFSNPHPAVLICIRFYQVSTAVCEVYINFK